MIQNNCCGCFGHWLLKFEIYLKFGAWDLEFYFFWKLLIVSPYNGFEETDFF